MNENATSKLARPTLRRHLRQILEEELIRIAFQPILNLHTGEVIGQEALTRPDSSTPFTDAGELYECAHRCDVVYDLEALARRKAIEAFLAAGYTGNLFLNNSPRVVADDRYCDSLMSELAVAGDLSPCCVVLELTEHTGFEQIERLKQQTEQLRDIGFQIAIDDVGAGTSGLNRIMAIRPNWLKLDRELIKGIDHDPYKQNLVRFLVRFGRVSNLRLVAEGIERREELQRLIDLGVDSGQGFYLARPECIRQVIDERIQNEIVRHFGRQNFTRYALNQTCMIKKLAEQAFVCGPGNSISDVSRQLRRMPLREGAVVVTLSNDHLRSVGWIHASDIDRAVHAGHGDMPVSEGLEIEPCRVVSSHTTVIEAFEQLTSESGASHPGRSIGPLAVVEGDRVLGILTASRLIRAAAEAVQLSDQKLQCARSHIADITGLPDRVRADQLITDVIAEERSVWLIGIDLSNFDGFNTAFGHEMGDQLLQRLATLIQGAFQPGRSRESETPFVAHLGADRFLVVCESEPHSRLERLSEAFGEEYGRWCLPASCRDASRHGTAVAEDFDGDDAVSDEGSGEVSLRFVAVSMDPGVVYTSRQAHQRLEMARSSAEVSVLPGGAWLISSEIPKTKRYRASA